MPARLRRRLCQRGLSLRQLTPKRGALLGQPLPLQPCQPLLPPLLLLAMLLLRVAFTLAAILLLLPGLLLKCPLFCSRRLAGHQLSANVLPHQWLHRRLFAGQAGCRRWRRLCRLCCCQQSPLHRARCHQLCQLRRGGVLICGCGSRRLLHPGVWLRRLPPALINAALRGQPLARALPA